MYIKKILILMFLMTFFNITIYAASSDSLNQIDLKKGDINKDGLVDSADAAIALNLYKYNNVTTEDLQTGDMDENGMLDSADAAMILNTFKYGIDTSINLEIPQNLKWTDRSTITWNSVENANYYVVDVSVYKDNILIGNKQIGTNVNKIDVLETVKLILKSQKFAPVQVFIKVKSMLILESDSIESDFSNTSEGQILKEGSNILATPQNINLTENYVATWTKVEGASYYRIEYKIITSDGLEKTGYAGQINYGTNVVDGVISSNVEELLKYAYKDALYSSNDEVHIAIRIQAVAPYNTATIDSNYSEYSNLILYPKKIQLATPQEATLSEELYGTWITENFTFADQIGKFELDYKIIYDNSEKTGHTNLVSRYSCSNPEGNVIRVYLKELLNQVYTEAGYTREKVQISYRVRAITGDTAMYKDSEYSEYSNFISFAYDGKNPLEAPEDVVLSEEFKGSWTKVDNADFYSIEYKIKYNGCEKIITSDSIEYFNLTENNGVLTTDLEEGLKNAYMVAGYVGEKVQISYRIAASVRYYDFVNKYTDGLYSNYSNEIYYSP